MSDSSPSRQATGAASGGQLGRYRLVARLGQGGMGTIHLAVVAGLGDFRKPLVLKELKPELTRDATFMQMFLSEAKLAAQLSHPNVVHTIEASQDDGRYFLVMEFLDGQPLSEVMRASDYDPRLSLGLRLHALCDALSGLHYAHELRDYEGMHLSVVHRDVSPHNVFVTYDGQVKVVDFGIAKVSDVESVTVPGVFKGRFAYAAPEQVRGQPVDRRADIFSVGVMLWEAVSMRRFARGKPTQEMVGARIGGQEPRLVEVMPDVDPVLAQICDRAMQVDPAKRFPTAEAFRNALQQYLVVSGQEVETAAVAQAMRSVFATQREAMHKLIAPALADGPTNSTVRPLLPVPPPQDTLPPPPQALSAQDEPEDVTAVTDLTELVEATRTDLPTPDDMALNPARRPRTLVLALAGAAALIVGGYLAQRSANSVPEQDVSAAIGDPTGTGLEETTLSKPPGVVQAAETADGDQAANPALGARGTGEPSASASADRSAARPQRSSAPQRPASARPSPAPRRRPTAQASAQTRAETGVLAPSEAPVTDAPEAGMARAPGLTPNAGNPPGATPATLAKKARPAANPAAKADTDSIAAGQDLRQLRKRERRTLDLEDPFQ